MRFLTELPMPTNQLSRAYFCCGCFWCVQAAFSNLRGVTSATSGYLGGASANPTYEQVCSGRTGHIEAVEVAYDPAVIPYGVLLDVFFTVHDPTTRDRQGADAGTQYRSAIFGTEAELAAAKARIAQLEKDGVFGAPIVTELRPPAPFYPAETYHQDYYAKNEEAPYCRAVINPKLKKVREGFRNWWN